MKLNWIPLGKGRMALGHRPKLRAIPHFPAAGCDCFVTLLSEKEGATQIGSLVRENGMRWIWIPLASGNPPRTVPVGVDNIQVALQSGFSAFSALFGRNAPHRQIAFAVLRRMGYLETQCIEWIKEMRVETHTALSRKHIDWGNSISTSTSDDP